MIFVTAFMIGLMGSWHCLGMCGPLLACSPGGRFTKGYRVKFFTYHSGRILSYISIGFIFFLLGKTFDLLGIQKYISLSFGALLIAVALFSIITKRLRFSKIEGFLGMRLFSIVQKVFSGSSRSTTTSFSLGIINGFLPCGLVYITAIGGLVVHDMSGLVLYMGAFGLGTLPLLILFSISKAKLASLIPYTLSKSTILQYSFLLIGAFMLLRGLELGIPFLSPEFSTSLLLEGKSSCH